MFILGTSPLSLLPSGVLWHRSIIVIILCDALQVVAIFPQKKASLTRHFLSRGYRKVYQRAVTPIPYG